MPTLIEEKAKAILTKERIAIGVLPTGEKQRLRIFHSAQGHYCYKPRGKRNSGYPLNQLNLIDLLPLTAIKRKTNEQIWRDSWMKVRDRLEKSGLWAESVLINVKTALDVGYAKIQEAYRASDVMVAGVTYQEQGRLRAEAVKKIDERLVKDTNINTSILWYMHQPARVKKMHFGVFNESVLEHIAQCISKKETCHEHGQKGYDISFEYNAEKNKAWYSEEYRGCGNGHYYLALDATHALFNEDD